MRRLVQEMKSWLPNLSPFQGAAQSQGLPASASPAQRRCDLFERGRCTAMGGAQVLLPYARQDTSRPMEVGGFLCINPLHDAIACDAHLGI